MFNFLVEPPSIPPEGEREELLMFFAVVSFLLMLFCVNFAFSVLPRGGDRGG